MSKLKMKKKTIDRIIFVLSFFICLFIGLFSLEHGFFWAIIFSFIIFVLSIIYLYIDYKRIIKRK